MEREIGSRQKPRQKGKARWEDREASQEDIEKLEVEILAPDAPENPMEDARDANMEPTRGGSRREDEKALQGASHKKEKSLGDSSKERPRKSASAYVSYRKPAPKESFYVVSGAAALYRKKLIKRAIFAAFLLLIVLLHLIIYLENPSLMKWIMTIEENAARRNGDPCIIGKLNGCYSFYRQILYTPIKEMISSVIDGFIAALSSH